MEATLPSEDDRLKGSVRLGGYLRKLREGYGYSLRRVEERARAVGGEIDNSQLSRYEKGICFPSFDKLRVLAGVFNVSVQAFSDVCDLEEFQHLRPETGDPAELVDSGIAALREGDAGLAFARFERAIELLLEQPDAPGVRQRIAQARIDEAAALIRLGKLALAEQELRVALRDGGDLGDAAVARAMLALANVHVELGDLHLAELESDRAHEMAEDAGDRQLAARALHTGGFLLARRGRHASAIEKLRIAASRYDELSDPVEAARSRLAIGVSLVASGKHREGIRLLEGSVAECRELGHRRLEALAWSHLGEAWFRADHSGHARRCLRESDTLSGGDRTRFADVLFVNAYYEWRMARLEEHPTREKIAFGRLKALRSGIEKRFPELDEFDQFIERRGGSHA